MNVQELRNEADKMRAAIQTLRADADKARATADGHERNGDTNAAQLERRNIDEYLRRATELEQQIEQAEREALEKVRKAQEIESKQAQLRKDLERQIADMDREKASLTGGSIGIF